MKYSDRSNVVKDVLEVTAAMSHLFLSNSHRAAHMYDYKHKYHSFHKLQEVGSHQNDFQYEFL